MNKFCFIFAIFIWVAERGRQISE